LSSCTLASFELGSRVARPPLHVCSSSSCEYDRRVSARRARSHAIMQAIYTNRHKTCIIAERSLDPCRACMYFMMSGVGRRRAEPRARTPYISQTVQLEDQSAPQAFPFEYRNSGRFTLIAHYTYVFRRRHCGFSIFIADKIL